MARMMLISLVNVTPGQETADYEVFVLVTDAETRFKRIAQGKVREHERTRGWRELLKLAAAQCDEWEDL